MPAIHRRSVLQAVFATVGTIASFFIPRLGRAQMWAAARWAAWAL